MLTYGFYDSINTNGVEDRVYDAEQFGSIFDGIIADGVYKNIPTCFAVTPASGMTVNIGPGRAWFNHTWSYNDSPEPITILPADTIFNRIDAVCLQIDKTIVRANSFIVISGTPAANPVKPVMPVITDVYTYPLAYITVRANTTSIATKDIKSAVGKDSSGADRETPWIITPDSAVTLEDIVDPEAMQAEWQALMDNADSEVNAYLSGFGQWQEDLFDLIRNEDKSLFPADHEARLKLIELQIEKNVWGITTFETDPEGSQESEIIGTDDQEDGDWTSLYDLSESYSFVKVDEFERLLSNLVMIKAYNYTYTEVAANSYLYIRANDIMPEGNHPNGYTPIAVLQFCGNNSTPRYFPVSLVNVRASGTGIMMAITNISSQARAGTASIRILYVKNSVL